MLLLLTVGHVCAMHEQFTLDITPAIKPETFTNEAIQAAQQNQFPKSAVYAALHKICTRVDTSCIKSDFNYECSPVENGAWTQTDTFRLQTGPLYHESDPIELKPVIENPNFKEIFAQQVYKMIYANHDNNLPDPYWVISHLQLKNHESDKKEASAEPFNYFYRTEKWSKRRSKALEQYYNEPCLSLNPVFF